MQWHPASHIELKPVATAPWTLIVFAVNRHASQCAIQQRSNPAMPNEQNVTLAGFCQAF